MHQTRKGNQWDFGLKSHVSGWTARPSWHSVATSAANLADSHPMGDLLHGEERKAPPKPMPDAPPPSIDAPREGS